MKKIYILLVIFLAAHGVLLLTVLPPFEGWDEPQHVAYIQHLIETKEQPVFPQAKVSRELAARLAVFPHPQSSLDKYGVMAYSNYFSDKLRIGGLAVTGDKTLYEAQHGKLYYLLVAPLFIASGGIFNLLQSVNVLRLLNLFLTIFSLILFIRFISATIAKKTHASLLALIACCHPLFLINGVRVANDALGIMLGTLVVLWGLTPAKHARMVWAVSMGLLLGFSVWVKSTNTSLLLFILACLAFSAYQKKISWRQGIIACVLFTICAIIADSSNIFFNIAHYRMVFPMQEAIANNDHGKTLVDLAIAGWRINLPKQLFKLWTVYNTWIGGWSFLIVPFVPAVIAFLYTMAAAGWAYRVIRPCAGKSLFQDPSLSFRLFFLFLFISCGLAWHMVQSYLAFGLSATTPWYACIAFPFMLLLLYEGVFRISSLAAAIFGWLLVFLYLSVETYGIIFKMLPCYSGGMTGLTALRRISLLHPSWLGTTTFFASAVTAILLFIIITVLWFREAAAGQRHLQGDR